MAFRSVHLLRSASLRAALLACASGAFIACGDDDKGSPSDDTDASSEDGGSSVGGGKSDAGASDGGQTGSDLDAGSTDNPVDSGSGDSDAGCVGSSCSAVDPLAPWALDCGNLPKNTTCEGGPREVLLAMETTGWIVMLDPQDGHFLGYFKQPSSDYTLNRYGDYYQATQGPDQCIWTVSEDEHLNVQRWDTDGSPLGKALDDHLIEVTGQPPQPAIDEAHSLAFTADRVLVGSTYGTPNPRITRWKLDGTWDGVVLEDGAAPRFLTVMGDGAMLVSDYQADGVVRYPADGGKPEKVTSLPISVPSQMAYLGEGKLLVANSSGGEPLNTFDLATGIADTLYLYPQNSSNIYGVAALHNGKWLVAGGSLGLTSVDPNSVNPRGQYASLFDEPAIYGANFKFVGRACLSEAFVSSRAPKAAVTTCTVPAGTPILSENFESGDFTGSGASQAFKSFHALGTAGVTLSLETPAATGSTRALKIVGGTDSSLAGVRVTFSSAIKPSYVSYRVRALYEQDLSDNSLGDFSLSNSAVLAAEDVDYYNAIDVYLYNDYVHVASTNASKPDQLQGKWAHVELRNIDWQKRSYDFYVDCVRIAEGLALPAGYGDDVDQLDLYNWVGTPSDNTVAWFDDIVIL